MTWYTLFERTAASDQGPGPGWTVRQRIPVASYEVGAPPTGTKLRLTCAAGSNSLNTATNYIGHGGTDPEDFDGTQVHLLYSTSGSQSVASGGTQVSDEVLYTFDKTKPLVISAETSFPSVFKGGTDAAVAVYNITGATHGADTDVTIANGGVGTFLWPKVEVWFDDPPGAPTCTINKKSTQSDPTSGAAIVFSIAFNKGVTGLIASDLSLSGSTVNGGSGAGLSVSLAGSGLSYEATVTGMVTPGNVVVSVPASVCVDAGSTANAASTSTDNVVAWDPDIIDPLLCNVYETTIADRNVIRFEVRDPLVQVGHTEVLGSPDSGAGTYTITGAADNGHGQIRLTTSYAAALGSGGGYYISGMANNGSGLIRCTMYDTSLLGSSLTIRHARGTIEANGTWTISVINSTHFDLVGSTFTNTYTGGAIVTSGNGGSRRVVVHSVLGTTEANGAWAASRSGTGTIDLANETRFANGYTSGGVIVPGGDIVNPAVVRPNPSLGGANDSCHIIGRFADVLRFQDIRPPTYLNRAAALVAGNYAITGGLTVSNIYLQSKPYTSGYNFSDGSVPTPTCGFRHYVYVELSGNLVSGNSYTVTFPSLTGLPPKTFTFNDKVTRFAAIHADQAGHRPADPGKFAALSLWTPYHGTHGEWDYSAITNWHIINSSGSIVWSAGAAPAHRVGPTGKEGLSFDSPSHLASTTKFVRDMGAPAKAVSVSKASTGHVTLSSGHGARFANGDTVSFSGMRHFVDGGTDPHGMHQLEDDGTRGNPSNPYYYDVTNLSGDTFDLGCVKSVSAATVASGGTGWAVGNILQLNNRVRLQVDAVSGGVITAVSPVPNESFADPAIGGTPPYASQMSGVVYYPYTTPSNPQSRSSTVSGSGSGGTFNLTWSLNPFDRNVRPGMGGYGNPDTTGFDDFNTSTRNDTGNELWKVNIDGNKASTNVYGLDYAAATLTPGTYYVYIANYGVSDPIVVRESAWYDVAHCYLKGMYNERQGCVLDGRFGFVRSNPGFKSRAGHRIYRSYMPYTLGNYANPRGPLLDINAPHGVGGGYDPWITTTEFTGFGGHVDAGDWDSRIIETGSVYWQVLDTWQHIGSASKTSLVDMGLPTLLSLGLDATLFAGTDSLPDPLKEVVWGLEPYRASQEVSGATIGGVNYGEGVPDAETSGNTTCSLYTWYPDPVAALCYASPAAKLAKVLNALGGFTTLANHYRDSAIAAYDWAVSMYTDSTARDAWFLPTKTRAQLSTPAWDAGITQMLDQVPLRRAQAAASLYALTGTTAYKTFLDTYFGGSAPQAIGAVYGPMAGWEYGETGTATGTFKADMRTSIMTACFDSLVLYAEAPDVTYPAPISAGGWSMAFGAANNFVFTHHLVMGYVICSDATDVANYSPTNAARCLAALQKWFGHRHGANQIGLCMTNGLGVRNNLETLHSDSRNTSQALPIGLCSEGWSNDFPGVQVTGMSNGKMVQEPIADPEMVDIDPSCAFRELRPNYQLAIPRWEYFLEISGAIEHSEFTVQQQMIPAFAGAMFLHGFDGNADIGAGGDTPPVADVIVHRPRIRLR